MVNGFVCGPTAPLTPCRSNLYYPNYHDFGPRFGFAWSPEKANDRLVLRGGFGMIFNRNSDVVYDNVRQDTPFSALATACCFFDPGPIVGPARIQHLLCSWRQQRPTVTR